MFYFMMHSKYFYFGYIASNILDKDAQITREKTVPLCHGLFSEFTLIILGIILYLG